LQLYTSTAKRKLPSAFNCKPRVAKKTRSHTQNAKKCTERKHSKETQLRQYIPVFSSKTLGFLNTSGSQLETSNMRYAI